MVLRTIYVVRHGVWNQKLEAKELFEQEGDEGDEGDLHVDYRMNWVVDPSTGIYSTAHPTPTGIPSDPALAAYGLDQARQLAAKVVTLDPKPTYFYSSPFYRCLQTLKPSFDRFIENMEIMKQIRVEYGLGEFFGSARFEHPQAAALPVLSKHFGDLSDSYSSHIRPYAQGETIDMLHDRFAYALHHIIKDMDGPGGAEAIIISTHAAGMIALGRALTGNMPDDPLTEDFRCGTCSLSRFDRRPDAQSQVTNYGVALWNPERPEQIPSTDWRGGRGVGGGWDCTLNGDCSFLRGGEERTWNIAMEIDPEAKHNTRPDDIAPPLPPRSENRPMPATQHTSIKVPSSETEEVTDHHTEVV